MALARWMAVLVIVTAAAAALIAPGCESAGHTPRAMSQTPPEVARPRSPMHAHGRLSTDDFHCFISQFADTALEHAIRDPQLAHFASTPLIAANEELWVIQRPARQARPPLCDEPGCGALVTRIPGDDGQPVEVPIPLKHTAIHASITGFIATVQVVQQFHNPFDSKIEALYIFPLPENAAISEFIMNIGERRIRGIIREREEAQRIYHEARNRGHTASLLQQERPNIFTQMVANIEPGKQIDVDIRYFHTLAYYDGGYEFVFPMVVGPRFNPHGYQEGIGASPRRSPGLTGQPAEVPYLRPHERTGHEVSLTVDLDAAVAIESIQSRTHIIAVNRDQENPSRATVRLSPNDALPNKDFVLRYAIAGRQIKTALITEPDPRAAPGQRGGYFTLMIVPPAAMHNLDPVPLELVFVIDRSGSMSGIPLQQVKAAAARALRQLQPSDTFQVVDFSDQASQLGNYPLEANRRNIQQGLDYINGLNAGGGTYMIPGLRASLQLPHDGQRLRFIALLTDGLLGNEAEVMRELARGLGSSRIFGFGVGSAPNRYLIDSMSRLGRGAVAYLNASDPAADIMDAFLERIRRPAMTDLRLESSARISEVYPSRLPDLFVGRPVIITGRYEGELSSPVRIVGRAGQRTFTIEAEPERRAAASVPQQLSALAAVWARMKIADLHQRLAWHDPHHPHNAGGPAAAELNDEIRRTALHYGLMSPYTSFVAVDTLTRTDGEYGTTVAVPVPVPEGVRYDTTVPGELPIAMPRN
jgi:Ca-activated chloride channel homolog